MIVDLQTTRKAVKLILALGEANSQKDLAFKLGYTESAFSQVLKSKQKLSGRFVRNIYNFTNSQYVKNLLDGKELDDNLIDATAFLYTKSIFVNKSFFFFFIFTTISLL